MVQTRSMSKIVVRASKQTRKKNEKGYSERPTIESEAMCIFMDSYVIRHRHDLFDFAGLKEWRQMATLEKAPLLKTAALENIDPVDFIGQAEWRQMSALQKAPFIKTAMERRRAKPLY